MPFSTPSVSWKCLKSHGSEVLIPILGSITAQTPQGGGVTGQPSVSVNWLDWIDVEDPESVSDAASLAETLVVRGHAP